MILKETKKKKKERPQSQNQYTTIQRHTAE